MTQIVDSAQWTGISTDPFAALSTEERQGLVQYDATNTKLFKPFALIGLFALVSVVLIATSLSGGIKPYRGNRISSRLFDQLLENLGVGPNMAGFIFGVVLLGATGLGLFALNKRLKTGALFAPLIISGNYLSLGNPALKLMLRDVNAVRFQQGGGFSTVSNQPAFPAPVAPNEYPKLEVLYGTSEPLILDLAVLNEKADRIAAVLQYRVLKARGEIDA